MRVILIGPVYPYRGGIAHYTTQLSLAFQSAGHTCEVISFQRQYPTWLYPGSSDKDPSQTSIRVPAEYLLDPLYPWTWLQTGQRIVKKSTELVVLQWWTTFWTFPFAYMARWCRRRQIPLVYLIHNVLPHEEKFWDRTMAKMALSPANSFVVQTEKEKERLLSLFPQAVCEVSAHPPYTMLTNQRIDRLTARQKLGLPLDQIILLFFGIVRPYKGLKYLIEALSILKSDGQTPTLLVAGDFWEDRTLYQKQVEALDLSRQVIFDARYIPDEDAALMFSAVDGLVAPYVGGTQSGVAGIALGFGLPLIVTEQIAAGLCENPSDLVSVVPPGDPKALAQAISKIMSRPNKIPSEQTTVQDGWEKLVNVLVSLYKQINTGV